VTVSGFVKEFKEFVNRGNVVDLAVAVVIGAAFGVVIDAFTTRHGLFLTALIRFLLVAVAVFLVVKALNDMQRRRARGETPADEEPPPPTDVELLAEIRDLLAAQGRRPEA
jgi:large conductance mechanosensitive channel